jgi:hypothetical protein
MLLVFIDETSDRKFKDYLGFCIATVNARFYPKIKSDAFEILAGIGWDPEIEFKGSFLFSETSGCTDVEIENRIDAANQILDLNVANKNRRMKFYFGSMKTDDHRGAYINSLPSLLHKILPAPPKGAGKNLIVVHCDERSDINQIEVHSALLPAIEERGYLLFETVVCSRSTFETIGLMYADLVGYLAGRIETISNDSELFEGLTDEQFARNGKIRKLKSSEDLIAKIKKLSLYEHSSALSGAA